MTKSRIYVLTINNPTETGEEWVDTARRAGARAGICQLEKGEEGTPHLQCFVSFANAKHFNAVKKIWATAHIETCKSAFHSWEYCSKSDTRVEGPWHFGEMPKPEKKKGQSYQEFNDACIKDPEAMVADGRLNIRDYTKIKQAVELYKLNTKTYEPLSTLDNVWYWGATGTGKSRTARQENPEMFIKPLNKWWDGYSGEEVVLLDDFGKDHACLGNHLKVWADHYQFKAEVKGSTTTLRPRKIVVTSNYHPRDIWEDSGVLDPILRRFKCVEFKAPFEKRQDVLNLDNN